jgi:hypothetical protein
MGAGYAGRGVGVMFHIRCSLTLALAALLIVGCATQVRDSEAVGPDVAAARCSRSSARA